MQQNIISKQECIEDFQGIFERWEDNIEKPWLCYNGRDVRPLLDGFA